MTAAQQETRPAGAQRCTVPELVRYLVGNFTESGQPITEDRARALIGAHQKFVDDAIGVFGSNTYYVGDQIAEKTALVEIPSDESTVWDAADEDDD